MQAFQGREQWRAELVQVAAVIDPAGIGQGELDDGPVGRRGLSIGRGAPYCACHRLSPHATDYART